VATKPVLYWRRRDLALQMDLQAHKAKSPQRLYPCCAHKFHLARKGGERRARNRLQTHGNAQNSWLITLEYP